MLIRDVFRFAAAPITAIVLATAAAGHSDEAVRDAEDWLLRVKDRFNVGEVTRTDVRQAEYHLLEMQYEAGAISKPSYCEQAVPILQEQGQGLLEESRVGQRTTQDVIELKRKLYRLKALCR